MTKQKESHVMGALVAIEGLLASYILEEIMSGRTDSRIIEAYRQVRIEAELAAMNTEVQS